MAIYFQLLEQTLQGKIHFSLNFICLNQCKYLKIYYVQTQYFNESN
ncbi:hypothetical protein pb186bvf_003159 [Paramecium bursaria]